MHETVKIAKDHELFKAFAGIHEKILIGLYNVGALKKLASGDVLFRDGERDHTIHLLLKGRLRLLKRTGSTVRQVALCQAGDVLCESLFFVPSATLTAAVATQSSMVLSFSEALLETLDPSSSAFLTKKIVDTYQRRLQEQMAKQEALSAHCDFMIRFARRSIVERTQDYTQSEMIVGMLKKVPQLPMYASRLAHMLLDANMSAKDMAALAKNDPSLVSAVLKRVNSAYYNWQKKISDF